MAWSLFRRSPAASPTTLPKESYIGLQLERDGTPDVWLVNQALIGFADTARFPWNLSMIVEMEETLENGMPTSAEQRVLGEMGQQLADSLKANDNGLFVASGSWQGVRHLYYQIRDPEIAQQFLQGFVASPVAVRAMEYRMESDPTWSHVEQLLDAARRAQLMPKTSLRE